MALSAQEFLCQRLLDREAGGVFCATEPAGQQQLSSDKYLPDQASAVLALAERGTDEDLLVAVEGLVRMQDACGHPGFCELTDRWWHPRPAGEVRTVRYQLHAAAALLTAAQRLGADTLGARAVDVINRCLALARDGLFPVRLAEHWQVTTGDALTARTSVSAIRAIAIADAVAEPEVDRHGLARAAGQLVQVAGAARQGPLPSGLRRCGAVADLIAALAEAARMLHSEECLQAATTVADMVLNRFLDGEGDAYWDRLAPDGSIAVDWFGAADGGQSPFPVVRTADAARVLLAGRLLARCGIARPAMCVRANDTITRLTDAKHGGVFLAMGFQWVTGADPVAPVVESSWPLRRQPGHIADAGAHEISLCQKPAHTQALVAQACGASAGSPPVTPAKCGAGPDGTPATVLGNRLPPEWPEGHDAPAVGHRLSEIFPAVASRRLLDRHHRIASGLIGYVRRARNADGGFGERPGRTSNVLSTYCGVAIMHLAGEPLEGEIDYLTGCQRPDGGFGAIPGMAGDVWHTGLAVAALHMLGAEPADAGSCVGFVVGNRLPDGRYANRDGRRANSFIVRRAVSVLTLLGAPVPEPEATIAWLRDLQLPSGGFAHLPGRPASIMSTHHATAALAMLSSRPKAAGRCERWLTAPLVHQGGAGSPDTFAVLQSLAILRGATGLFPG